MRQLTILKPNERLIDPILEDHLKKRDSELQDLSLKNSKHFAKSNQPRATGDRLASYIGDIKRAYEKLGAEIQQKLQTNAQFTDAKMDIEYAKMKDEELETEIEKLNAENQNDERNIDGFNPTTIPTALMWIAIISVLIFLGETIYTINSVQVIGENLLFALLISISITTAILMMAHFTAVLFRKTNKKINRWWIIAGSLGIATLVFIGLGILRSKYLAAHGIDVSPVFFVVINLVFYIVTICLSLFVYPTKEEMAHHKKCNGFCKLIKERKAKINDCKLERENIKNEVLEKSKLRARIIHYSNSLSETVRRMYKEAIEIFKSNNLALRTDRKNPDCFNDSIDEPDIPETSNYLLNRKAS